MSYRRPGCWIYVQPLAGGKQRKVDTKHLRCEHQTASQEHASQNILLLSLASSPGLQQGDHRLVPTPLQMGGSRSAATPSALLSPRYPLPT